MRNLVPFLKRCDRFIIWLNAVLTGGLLLAMSVLVIWLIFARYVLNSPVFWGDEVARFLMFFLVMIGSALALRTDQHPRLSMIVALMPKSVQRILAWFTDAVVLGTLLVIFFQGLQLAQDEAIMRTPSLRLSYFWIYIAYPIGGGFALFQHLVRHIFPENTDEANSQVGAV